jgi:hypothetical protein
MLSQILLAPLTRPAGTLSPHPMRREGRKFRRLAPVTLSLRGARGEGRGEGCSRFGCGFVALRSLAANFGFRVQSPPCDRGRR